MPANLPLAKPNTDAVTAFVDTLFDSQEGFIYSPTKNSATGAFQQYFFSWPDQRSDIISHIMSQSRSVDVYLSPSIFSRARKAEKDDFKGTQFIWTEFDGNAPEELPKGLPKPSIRIQSSTKGHEHWYWKLQSFETDQKVVEELTKKITYTLEADRSGWAANKVLRPPGTLHHESKRRVRLLKLESSQNSLSDFKGLIEAPDDVVVNTNLKDVPDIQDILRKYKWQGEAYQLFKRKEQPKGSRSSAYTRLAFECVEMGMSNEEIYSVLYNADERWKKYATRTPESRTARLIGIINHVRSKKSVQAELLLNETQEPVYILDDFLKTDIKIEWLFENLLMAQGLGIIAAAPGARKSQLSFQMALHSALGKMFLQWQCKKKCKVLIVSAEMGHLECQIYLNTMLQGLGPEEQEKVRSSIVIMPLGYALHLDKVENQRKILDLIETHEIDFVIMDSLKATCSKLEGDPLDNYFHFINKEVRSDRQATVWLVHHTRKPGNEGSRKPQDVSDLYGDQYIGAHATTVISPWKRSKTQLEILNFKTRLAAETDDFLVNCTPYLDFVVTNVAETPDDDMPRLAEKKGKEVDSNGKAEGTETGRGISL